MSAAQSPWGAAARVRPAVAVAVTAALVALGAGGQGLLVPAGPADGVVRTAGAVVSLVAAGAAVRIDGPALAARTLVVVAVAGALTTLATLPFSPVTLSDSSLAGPRSSPGAPDPAAPGGVVLDRPGGGGGATGPSGSLTVPHGASVTLEDDRVVLRMPDGSSVVLGRATAGSGAPTPAAPGEGQRAAVVVTGGAVSRTDGRPIGGDTALGGVALEGSGATVVVGEGVLLDVPPPLPAEPVPPLTDGSDALLAVLLACFALLAFAPPVVRVADRVVAARTDPEPPPSPAPGSAHAGQVEEGLADVLRSMLADPDPRTAVIGAYARLLSALAEAGHGRRIEETPHEHLWRALGPLGVRRAPVHRLAELFVQARFTPRPLTGAHRDAAIGALADAVADLRLPAHDVHEAAGSVGVRA